jgi:DNA invertase Pin-like site-specific DNA recombinase
MKLIAYIRVSSEGQLDAFGPEAQEEQIRTWARHYRHRIVAVLTDDISGTVEIKDRPKLVDALDAMRNDRTISGLVIANLGRLARELTIQEAILAMVWSEGRNVYAADQGEIPRDDPDDPMRTAMRQMQGVFMQLDRAMIAKRLRDGRRIKAAEGRHWTGHYRYGEQRVVHGRQRDAGPNPNERRVIETIKDLRRAKLSLREIAASLDAQGVKPRYADSWNSMSVRNILRREGMT